MAHRVLTSVTHNVWPVVVVGLIWLGVADPAAARWRIQHAPEPTGSHLIRRALDGVSCVSSSGCIAVGFTENSVPYDTPLVERWNGRRWTMTQLPKVRGTNTDGLYSVSCVATNSCFAVGLASVLSHGVWPLVERWTGRRWRGHKLPASNTSFSAVACASRTSCEAVGQSSDMFGSSHAFVERWNGRGWAPQANPASASSSSLFSISCASSSACTALGEYWTYDAHGGSSVSGYFAERWNGRRWRMQELTEPSDAGPDGIWCSDAHHCVVVGQAGSAPFANFWNRRGWHSSSPTRPGRGSLQSVSCVVRSRCTAIGISSNPTTFTTEPFAERWDGMRWSMQAMPTPRGGSNINPQSTSCASIRSCVAVGNYSRSGGGGSRILIERWKR